jgi:thymidylate synthase
MNNFSETFISLIRDIERKGSVSQPRDLKVKELIYGQIDIDSTKPIANFEDRKFNFKYFAGELAWYLQKDTNIDYINKFSNFWKNITNTGTNEINSNYGALLFNDQLAWCLDSLKKDKNTRQAIAFLNQPKYQFEGNKDFVCTMYLNFFIRDNKLNMKVQMRSNDIFYGLTFDAPFFAFVHQHMYLWLKEEAYTNLELGTYTHFADNIHFYQHHFELADKIKSNGSSQIQYDMSLKKPLFYYHQHTNGKLEQVTCVKGLDFIKNVNALVEVDASQEQYRELLSEYLNIKVYGKHTNSQSQAI